jgi:hypothetical protein
VSAAARSVAGAALAVALAGSAPAAGYDMARFKAALTGPGVQDHVIEAAKRSQVLVHNPCPSAAYKVESRLVVYRAPEFDASGMVAGEWKETVAERGCGASRLLNVLAVVRRPKSLALAPLLPGTTRANPPLQKEGERRAVLAMGGMEKGCALGYVADTAFDRAETAPANGGKTPPWEEIWTLVTCTKETRVALTFTPEASAVSIAVRVIETKPRGAGGK